MKGKGPLGVYVHIPYCAFKCPYCDFNSVAPGAPYGAPGADGVVPTRAVHAEEQRYVDALLTELSARVREEGLSGRPLASLYIGGGTPTVFSIEAIATVVEGAAGALRAAPGASTPAEVTVEANPGTIGKEGLKGLKAAGVTRLSIGVQSFSDRVLAALGRAHTAERAEEVYSWARQAGFDNVGVDLIFGAPGQTVSEWAGTLKKALALAPEHVSLYALTIEESTPFGLVYGKGAVGGAGRGDASGGVEDLPGEDTVVGMYSAAVEAFKEAGYEHYEISNFALPGRRSVHNTRYWLGGDYLGLGAGAHTYLSGAAPWGVRAWNERNPDRYMRMVEQKGPARAGGEELTREEAMAERVMLALRMLDVGIDARAFEARFGLPPEKALSGLAPLEAEGLVERRGADILLTAAGVLFSDEVFVRIL